jgi:hypothetical protein
VWDVWESAKTLARQGEGGRGQELQHREGTSRRGHAEAVEADRPGGNLCSLLLLSFLLHCLNRLFTPSFPSACTKTIPRLSDRPRPALAADGCQASPLIGVRLTAVVVAASKFAPLTPAAIKTDRAFPPLFAGQKYVPENCFDNFYLVG